MSAALKGRCIVGDQERSFQFDDWLPDKIPEIIIGINPDLQLLKKILSSTSNLWCPSWKHEGTIHRTYFSTPDNAHIQIDRWTSKSRDSSSLYPWWCRLTGNNGAPPVDLICQIQPRGSSSLHMHEWEPGIEVAEEYGSVWNDGKTLLRVGDEEPQPLLSQRSILPGQSHQLIRFAPDYSIQLLLMRSRKYPFPNRGGHIPC